MIAVVGGGPAGFVAEDRKQKRRDVGEFLLERLNPAVIDPPDDFDMTAEVGNEPLERLLRRVVRLLPCSASCS